MNLTQHIETCIFTNGYYGYFEGSIGYLVKTGNISLYARNNNINNQLFYEKLKDYIDSNNIDERGIVFYLNNKGIDIVYNNIEFYNL